MDRTEGPRVIWRKSRRSGAGDCVEIAFDGACVLMRDSKDRPSAVLAITKAQWLLLRRSIRGRHGDPSD
ncbi:DUF397 domain-containing protein [Actinomadura luteofluorescens]|uniref:DUF397 domain-containing protein n=1 Tax=Actinomadura luteofluorescens TaxID=46163 RepID=UPI00347B14B0